MQKVLGLVMLGGGLAFLISENAPSPSEREEQLAAVTRIVARATILEPETVPAEHPGLRRPVASPAATARAADPLMSTATQQAQATLPVVSVPNEAALRAPVTAATPPSPGIQRQLAREIQTELKRVGCYSGRVDGSWGDRSRSAMATFMARVNASLPTNEPDVFLLSLIKGQTDSVCGPVCGSSEVSSGGRCVPKTVVADSATSPAETAPPDPAPVDVAARPAPLPGRMSIGGPVAAQPGATAPITETTAPAAEPLPWQMEGQEGPPSTTMAALDPEDVTVENARPVPRKVTKIKRAWSPPAKPVKRRYSSSRSVQQLFLHPLGRM